MPHCRQARLASWAVFLAALGLACLLTSRAALPNPVAVTLVWDASSDTNVVGYRVYYGTISSNYTISTNVGNQLTATVGGLMEGTTYYFSATALDQHGQEEGFAPEISYRPGDILPALALAIPTNCLLFANGGPTVIAFTMDSGGRSSNSLSFYVSASDPLLFPVTNLLVSGSGSNWTLTLLPVPNRAGSASVTVVVTDGTVSNCVSLSVRTILPSPEGAALEYLTGQGAKVRVSSLLGTNSAGLQLASLSSASAQGGTLTSKGNWIFYTPPANLVAGDSFQYTVTDGQGALATNTVPISLRADTAPSANYTVDGAPSNSVARVTSGLSRITSGFVVGPPRLCAVQFDGIPFRTYSFSFTDHPSLLDWQNFGAGAMDPLGRYFYLDQVPENVPVRLYRTTWR